MKNQIHIDFDRKNKYLILSSVIFSSVNNCIPLSIRNFVEDREGKEFLPNITSFHLEKGSKVKLVQKIPFQAKGQVSLRKHICQFSDLTNYSSSMLKEVSYEEFFSALQSENLF